MDTLLTIAVLFIICVSIASTVLYFKWGDIPSKIRSKLGWVATFIFAIFAYFAYLIVSKRSTEYLIEQPSHVVLPPPSVSKEELIDLYEEVEDVQEEIKNLPTPKNPPTLSDTITPGHVNPQLADLLSGKS